MHLNWFYVKKMLKGLDLEDKTHYLTEPIRQSEMSDIAIYSKMVSAFILGTGPEPMIPFGDEIIKYENHEDFIQSWKAVEHDDKAILAFHNKTVKAYNNNISKYFRFQEKEYEVGNRVSLRGTVMTEQRHMIPNRKVVELKQVEEFEGYYRVISDEGTFLINKTASWLKEKLAPYVKAINWGKFYEVKEQYVQVHHADALTVHSSQGSTYDEVFIDATDIMQAPSDIRRLAYVAISRAKTKAHIFVGSERNYKKFKHEADDALLFD